MGMGMGKIERRVSETDDTVTNMVGRVISCDELKEICSLVVELTKLRKDGCKHLAIENFSPDLFAALLGHYAMHKQGKIYQPTPMSGGIINK